MHSCPKDSLIKISARDIPTRFFRSAKDLETVLVQNTKIYNVFFNEYEVDFRKSLCTDIEINVQGNYNAVITYSTCVLSQLTKHIIS